MQPQKCRLERDGLGVNRGEGATSWATTAECESVKSQQDAKTLLPEYGIQGHGCTELSLHSSP